MSAYLKEREQALLGRKRIYTDVTEINAGNIFSVLGDAFKIHERNVQDISFLIEYEKGMQPLVREKEIRPEINIEVSDNLANQIVEFKLGYNWGYPITFVQKSNKDMAGNTPERDDDAISQLNEMNDAESAYAKDQELARFVEICGVGYQMVDVKRDYDGGSVFDLYVLHPMYTFIVYRNDIGETPIMGVTYRETESGDRYFTCYTADSVYEVKNLVTIVNGDVPKREWSFRRNIDETGAGGYGGTLNPLGMVPIVEYVRAYDRMGCFERQISDMDALNVEVSDFANATAQGAQEIWWGNDFDFPKDPKTGERITPKSGQWVMTRTLANGTKPLIQPLSSTFDYTGVQENIVSKRNAILQKCYVPLQTDPGGGSTANAMSLSSGWAAAEASAAKEEQIIRRSKMQIVALELAAVKTRSYWLTDENRAIVDLKVSDVFAKFTRQKTYDLGTKTNAMVAMLKAGINGRHALETIDLFQDVAQTWNDSKETIEKFQKSLFERQNNSQQNEGRREFADMTDQTGNSPILDGMNTGNNSSSEGRDENA